MADRLCWNVPVVNFDMRLVLPTVDCPKMMILYEAATWLLRTRGLGLTAITNLGHSIAGMKG